MNFEEMIDWPETVPSTVRDRVQAIRDVAFAHAAARRSVGDEKRTARGELDQDRVKLAEYEASKDPSKAFAADQLRKRIERGTKLVASLAGREEAFSQAWSLANRLAGHIELYVRSNSSQPIFLHDGIVPKLNATETAAEGLERAARRTRTLRADRTEVLAAPFPSAVAKEIAFKDLMKRAAAAKPNVSGTIDRCRDVTFPKVRAPIEHQLHGGDATVALEVYGIDPVGLLAWLFPTEMRAAMDREIDAISEDEIALSAEQRVERLAIIDSDILASEREEATFAELAGVLPRPDIDPRAVLGLSEKMPKPVVT